VTKKTKHHAIVQWIKGLSQPRKILDYIKLQEEPLTDKEKTYIRELLKWVRNKEKWPGSKGDNQTILASTNRQLNKKKMQNGPAGAIRKDLMVLIQYLTQDNGAAAKTLRSSTGNRFLDHYRGIAMVQKKMKVAKPQGDKLLNFYQLHDSYQRLLNDEDQLVLTYVLPLLCDEYDFIDGQNAHMLSTEFKKHGMVVSPKDITNLQLNLKHVYVWFNETITSKEKSRIEDNVLIPTPDTMLLNAMMNLDSKWPVTIESWDQLQDLGVVAGLIQKPAEEKKVVPVVVPAPRNECFNILMLSEKFSKNIKEDQRKVLEVAVPLMNKRFTFDGVLKHSYSLIVAILKQEHNLEVTEAKVMSLCSTVRATGQLFFGLKKEQKHIKGMLKDKPNHNDIRVIKQLEAQFNKAGRDLYDLESSAHHLVVAAVDNGLVTEEILKTMGLSKHLVALEPVPEEVEAEPEVLVEETSEETSSDEEPTVDVALVTQVIEIELPENFEGSELIFITPEEMKQFDAATQKLLDTNASLKQQVEELEEVNNTLVLRDVTTSKEYQDLQASHEDMATRLAVAEQELAKIQKEQASRTLALVGIKQQSSTFSTLLESLG